MKHNDILDCDINEGQLTFRTRVWYATGTRTLYECWGFPCYEDDYDEMEWDFTIDFDTLVEDFGIDEDIWCYDNGSPDDVQIGDIISQMSKRYPKWVDGILERVQTLAQDDYDYAKAYDYNPYYDYDI